MDSLLPQKYRVIYADPAWDYEVWNRETSISSAELHYPVMRPDEIKSLPVKELADKDSVLLMWATYPLLPLAFEVVAAWGFKYKTVAFTWMKTNKNSMTPAIGMGHWTRSNAEICLLGTKGSPKRKSKSVEQAVLSPRREHSRKPDIIYERIERLVDGPYCELFARTQRPGWDSWGNQSDLFPYTPSLWEAA